MKRIDRVRPPDHLGAEGRPGCADPADTYALRRRPPHYEDRQRPSRLEKVLHSCYHDVSATFYPTLPMPMLRKSIQPGARGA